MGVSWDQMQAQPGFWSVNQTFYRCLEASHCNGGAQTGSATSTCAAFRTGKLCAACLSGYTEALGGSCRPCGTNSYSLGVFILAGVLIIAAVLVMMFVLLRSGRDVIAAAQQSETVKMKTSSGFMLTEGEEVDLVGFDANRYGTEITVHGPPAPKPDFTFKLKIALGFAQILSNVSIGIEIQWPNAFKSFLSFLTPANFDFVQVSSLGCVFSANYYTKLVIMTFGLYAAARMASSSARVPSRLTR